MPYLPPVVVTFTGDSKPFQTVLAEVKAELADFAKGVTNAKISGDSKLLVADLAVDKARLADLGSTVTTAPIGADSGRFQGDLATVKAELVELARTLTDASLGLNAERFWTEILALRAEVDAMSPLDLNADVNITEALSRLALLREALALATVDRLAEVAVVASDAQLTAKLAQARVQLAALSRHVTNMPLGVDRDRLLAEVAALRQVIARDPATLTVDGDIKPALLDLAALRGAAALAGVGAGGEFLAGLRRGGGGGGGIGGFLAGLGFRRGWSWPTPYFATFGSIGSLMGFGLEHAITTALGLAGSAVGAMLGGALLGAASLSVGLTGFATDLAGIGQAAGDIKMVYTDISSLNQAIGLYGKNSAQAASAQKQLNYDLSSFNPVARQAVLSVAKMGQAIQAEFDKYTGEAEKLGAQIIGMFGTVAEAYIPTIGKYATINMGIIKAGLVPFIAWLKNPLGGLGDFTTLEQAFTKNLPTAVHAFEQALEFLMKTMAYLAPETGKFAGALNRFFTSHNTTAGFDAWEKKVNHLVSLFHTWGAFFKVLVQDIAGIFSKSVGLGSGIIQTLTGDLERLHKALDSKAGGSALSSLFTTHKAEVIDLIQTIIQIGEAFTKMYLLAAPTMVRIATFFLKILDVVTNLIDKVPALATAFGFALLFAKLGVLGSLLGGASKDASILAKTFGLIGKYTGIQALIGWIGTYTSGIMKAVGAWVKLRLGLGAATAAADIEPLAIGSIAGASTAEAGTAGTSLGSALGVALAGAAALAVGYGIGTIINKYTNLSGRIASLFTAKTYSTSGLNSFAGMNTLAGLNKQLVELEHNQAGIAQEALRGGSLVLIPPVDPLIPGLIAEIKDKIHELTTQTGEYSPAAMKARIAATDYGNALAGLNAPVRAALGSVQTLVTHYTGLGSSIHGTANQIAWSIEHQNALIQRALLNQISSFSNWGTDVQELMHKGMSAEAVQYLEKYMPQALGTAASESIAQVARLSSGISVRLFEMKAAGAKSTGALRQVIVQGLLSSVPAVRAAAVAMEKATHTHISLAQEGAAAATSLINELDSNKPAVQAAGLRAAANVKVNLSTMGTAEAGGFMAAIVAALQSPNPQIRSLAQGLLNDIDYSGAGQGAGATFAQGLKNSLSTISPAAFLVGGLTGKSLLQGMSKSPPLYWVGEEAAAGFTAGLVGGTSKAITASKAIASQVTAAFGSLKNFRADIADLASVTTLVDDLSKMATALAALPAALAKVGNLSGVGVEIDRMAVPVQHITAAFAHLLGLVGQTSKLDKLAAPLATLIGSLGQLGAALAALTTDFNHFWTTLGTLRKLPWELQAMTRPVESVVTAFKHLLDTVGNTTALDKLAAPLVTLITTLGRFGTALAGLTGDFNHFWVTMDALKKLPYELHTLAGPVESVVTAYRHLLDGIGNTTALNKLATPLVSLIGTLGQLGTALGGLTKAFAHFGTTARSIRALPDELHDLDVPLQNVVRSFQHLVDMAGKTGALGAAAAPLPGVISTLGRLGTALSGLTTAFAKFGTTAATLRQLPKDLHDIDYPLQNVVRSFQHLVDTVGKTGNLGSVSAPLPGIITTLGRLGTALSALSGDFAKFGTTASTLRKLPDQLHDLDGPLRNVVLSFEHLVDTVGKTGNLGTVSAPLPGIITNLGHLGSALAGLTTDFAKFGTTARTIRELPKELHDLDGPLRDVVLSFEHLIDSVGKTGTLGTIAAPLPGVITILGQLGAALSGLTKDFTHFTATASAIRKLPDQLHDLDAPLQNVVRSFQHLLAGIGNTTALEKLGSPLPALIGELGQLGTALSALSKDFTGFTTTLVALKKLPSELHWFAIPIAETVQAFRHLLNAVGNTSALDKLATPLDTTLGLLGQFGTALGVVTKAFANFNTTISAVRQLPSELSQLSGPIQSAVKAFQSLLQAAGNTKGIQTAGTSLVGVVTALGGLGAALKALTPDFANFATTMTTLKALPGELQPLGTAIGSVLGSVKTALGGFGNLTTVSTGLSSVTTVFQRLATAFAEIGLAAKNAALVTPAAIKAIAAAVGLVTRSVTTNLGTQLASSVALGLGSSAPVTAMRNMIATLVRVAKSLAPEMVGVGEQLMKSLALGIEKGLKYPRKAIQEVPLAPRIAANYAAGSAGSSSQAITFHTEVKVNVNNAESANIARAIKQAMEQHDRNLVRSFRAGIGSGAIPRTV